MNPRDLNRRAALPAHVPPSYPIRIVALLACLLAVSFSGTPRASAASATVTSVSASPASPSTCDSVTLRVDGLFTSSCQTITETAVIGPDPIPEWVGPLPAYKTLVSLTVREAGAGCAAVVTPYSRSFPVGRLPFGQHSVTAVERLVDSVGTILDSSAISTSFTVKSDTCATPSCVLLGFEPLPSPTLEPPLCDASASPGGSGCFDVALGNRVPVGGVQLRIQITDAQGAPLPAGSFTPRAVATTTRSASMQVAWEADGSAAKVLLFSPNDAFLPAGAGPILRVCYDVGADAPAGVYRIVFEKSLVADGQGRELPLCPTFRESVGRFCVGTTQGCDLDGDGVADLRDIIRLVRCALAGDACPDTIAARADCNGDGTVDVRDVICCVRKLLLLIPGTRGPVPPPPDGWVPARLGFSGGATWTTSLQGRAAVALDPGTDFGGTEFEVTPPPGVRITSLALESSAGYQLEWTRDVDGRARALLLRTAPTAVGAARVIVGFERTGTGVEAGSLQIENAGAATWGASLAPVIVGAGSAPITAAPITAPAIYAARPNPFSGSTEIPFALPAAGSVSLRVYDVAGRLVRTLIDGARDAGVNRASWDGKDAHGRTLPGGIYFAKLSTAGVTQTSRIMKLR